MSDKVELLPCPFCGQQDAFVEQLDSDASVVICQGHIDEHSACLARGPVGVQESDTEDQPGKDAAIREWNRRAALSQQPAPAAVPDGYVLVTPEQLEKHTTTAWECPPQSLVVLVSSLKRLHDKNSAAPAPAAQEPASLPEGMSITKDFMGTVHIKLGDFDFIQIQYDHRYTYNSYQDWVARKIVEAVFTPPAAEQPAVPGQWIPVSERLPEIDQYVLLCTEFGGRAGDWRYSIGALDSSLINDPIKGPWFVKGGSWNPSHWMPLPAAPGVMPPTAEQPDTVPVPREQLKRIRRDLDACQAVIWLAGCGQQGYGFDPAYVDDAQESLRGINALLGKESV